MMIKMTIGIGLLVLALGAAAVARTGQSGAKLPKCSSQLCKPECSADMLCARGASVVSCAEVCGGN